MNKMSVVRSSNSGITDLIPGVTLNLASDAEGKSAVLSVGTDATGASNTIKSFISQFNTLQTYLTNKMAVKKVSDTQYNPRSADRRVKYDLLTHRPRFAGQQ